MSLESYETAVELLLDESNLCAHSNDTAEFDEKPPPRHLDRAETRCRDSSCPVAPCRATSESRAIMIHQK